MPADRKTNPTFADPNPSTNPFKDIKLQAGSNLGFADIDRDADPDAFSVKADGTIAYYENVSTVGGAATFVTNTNSDMNPFKVQTVATNGKVQFADLNGDKDLDAIVTTGSTSTVLENITVPKPVFTQNLNRINTDENGSQVSFGVRLSTKPTANVTLSIQSVDATETSFDKTTLDFTPDNWDQYQVVTATGVDDNLFDGTVNYAVRINGTAGDTFYKSTAAVLMVSNADNEEKVATGVSSSKQDNTLPQLTVNALNKTGFTVGLKATQAYNNNTIGLQLDQGSSGSTLTYTLTKGTQLTFNGTKVEVLQDIEVSTAGASIAAVKLIQGTAIAKDATGSFNFEQARFAESLSLEVTQSFSSGNVGLRVNQASVSGVRSPFYLLTAGTILTFGNTKAEVLTDTLITNGTTGTNVKVNLTGGTALANGVTGQGTPTGQIELALDRVVEFPIVALSALANGVITVKLDRILGTNPDIYNLKKGSLLRFGTGVEVELLADAKLTDAASGVALDVKLNKGTAIAANAIGTALPWVKVNFGSVNSTILVPQNLPFSTTALAGTSNSYFNRLTLGDLNKDSKPDLVFGNADGTLGFASNNSSGTTVSFSNSATNPFASINTALTTSNNKTFLSFNVNDQLYNSAPTLVDIDGDGDLDVVVGFKVIPLIGAIYGGLRLYRNTGTNLNPVFINDTSTDNPFASFRGSDSVVPIFGDLNGYGKQDLIVGTGNQLSYYINNSTVGTDGKVTKLKFDLATSDSNPFAAIANLNNPLPNLADIDGDGDLDLVVKNANSSEVRYFQNTGTKTAPKFTEQFNDATNPFNWLKDNAIAPTFADLNGDKFPDLFLGQVDGQYVYRLNTLSAAKSEIGVIKPGGTKTTLNIVPINDNEANGNQDLQFAVLAGDNYRLTTTNALNLADYLKLQTTASTLLSFPSLSPVTQTAKVPNSATVSNNILRLTNGANQVGEVFLSAARTLSNDYSFSSQFQLQVSGVTATTNPAPIALVFKSPSKIYNLSLANTLTNGTWNVWADYNGLTDTVELRYSQNTTRPPTASETKTISTGDLVGSSTNPALQVGLRATTTDVAVGYSLLNLSFRDTYNPTVDRVKFNDFTSTTGLTLTGSATHPSDNLSVVRLNTGAEQLGFLQSPLISTDNDGSFSTLVRFRVSGVTSGNQSGRFAMLFGTDAGVTFDNIFSNGTWNFWADYEGSTDLLKVYISQADTRPTTPYLQGQITKVQLLGSDQANQLLVKFGVDTRAATSYTKQDGTFVNVSQPAAYEILSLDLLDDHNPQFIDPQTQVISFSNFASNAGLAIAANTETLQNVTTNVANVAQKVAVNGVNVLRLANGVDQNSQVVSTNPIRFADDGSFSSFFKVQASGIGGTNTAKLDVILLSTGKEYSLPLGAALGNGLWNVWLDYSGKTDKLELRYSQLGDRPSVANLTQTVTHDALIGAGDKAQIGFRTATNSTAVTYDVSDWRVLDSYDPQAYDPLYTSQKFNPTFSDRVVVVDDDVAGVSITNSQGQLITSALNNIQPNLSENGTNQTFNVQLNTKPQGLVTVTLATNNNREGRLKSGNITSTSNVLDAVTLRFTPENWNVAQSVTVVGQDDAIDDGDVQFQVVTSIASSSDTNYNGLTLPRLTFTNTDNDSSGVVANGNLGDRANLIEGVTDGFALKLKSQPTAATESVRLTVSPITEQLQLNNGKAGASSTLTFNSSNWNQEQTIRANAIDDNVVEGTQKTILNLEVDRTISYKDFRDLSELVLQENAKQGLRLGDKVLRLADTAGTSGTAFYNAPSASLLKNESFETFFRFVSNDPAGTSQGVSLEIANDLLGSKNVKVRFVSGAVNNQIVIEENGVVKATHLISAIGRDSLGNDTNDSFNNNQAWGAWVSYDGSSDRLEVRLANDLNRPSTAQITYDGLKGALGSPSAAYLGLLASNGAAVLGKDNPTQDIIAWTIDGNDPAYSTIEFPNPNANIPIKTFRDPDPSKVKAPFDVEIKDNDLPIVSIQAGPKALEGKTPSYFTIALTNLADPTIGNTGIKVNYQLVSGTATNGQDYQQIASSGVVRVAPGEIQSNLLVVPIDDFISENVDFQITSFNSTTKSLGLKIADKVKIYDGTVLTFGKAGSTEGMVGKVSLNGVAGVVTDPDTQLKYVEISATNKPTLSIQRLSGTLAIDNTTTTGLQSAPFKVQSNTGSGLLAQYFNSKNNFTGTPALTRVDSQINFDWGLGSPDAKINSDNFSVRWTGYVQAPKTGLYTFYGNANEGVKLSVDGKVLINDLTDNFFGSVERTSTTIQLNAGQLYALQMDYYESTGLAASTLSWSAVDGNKATIVSKEIIGADKFSAFEQVSLGLGDFTLVKGSTLDLGGGIKATVQDDSKLINTTGTTVTVTLPDSANLNAIATGGKASLNAENVTVKLLAGDGYTLSGNSQATLEIADNDLAGLRIIQTGDRPIVQEAGTTDFQISLLSEPQSPVTVYLNPDSQLTVTNLNPPLLDAKLSSLSLDKTTGTLQLRLFRQPTADVTISVTPKSATDANQLIFNSTNWDQYQNVELASLTTAGTNLFNTTVKDSTGTNYSLRFQQIAEDQIDYLPPLGAKSFYAATFDASNWYIPQTVTIAAIDNNNIDEVLRDGSIKYAIVTGDPSYASLSTADQSIGIIDRLIDSKEVKAGIGSSLDTFKNSVNDYELPIIGKLGNDRSMGDIFDNLGKAIQDALDSISFPTAKALELAIEKKIGESAVFGVPEVTVKMDKYGVQFTINLGNRFTKEWKLAPDFGTGEGLIGASAQGGIELALEYDLTFAFGVSKDYGFYVDTKNSGIRLKLGGELTPDFSAEAHVGFIQVKATNTPQQPTGIIADAVFKFVDPDNRSTFKFFDVNSDGKFNGNPAIMSVPIGTLQNGKPLVDKDGKIIPKNVSIQEAFTEIDWKGRDKYVLPSLKETAGNTVSPAYSNIDWNGNKVFDGKSQPIKGKGVYRTFVDTPTAGVPAAPTLYYLDANRNGKVELQDELWTASDAWVDKTNPAVTKVKEFVIHSETSKVAGKNVLKYYFDRNGDGKYTPEEKLTAAQVTQYGVGTIKGDSTASAEGAFVRGRGIAYRDANGNGKLDLEPFVDTNANGIWDNGEATASNANGLTAPKRETFVMSGFKPIEVNAKALTTFLDVNSDGKQTALFSNSDRPDPNILNYSVQEKSYKFLNTSGDGLFDPVFTKDADGKDTTTYDNANAFAGDVKILQAQGKKFFYLDLNNDGTFSTGGETLVDTNENKIRDNGEFYLDLNGNGTWDITGVSDPLVNFGAPSLTFLDTNGDGKQTWLLDTNGNGIKDGAETDTTALIRKEEKKDANGNLLSSTFYLDTNGNKVFDSATEFKVIPTTFGNVLDQNRDGIYNNGDAVIVSQEGMIRKVVNSPLNNFDSTTFEYLDLNNDGQYTLGVLTPVPADPLIKSDAKGTYFELNGKRFDGKRIDFVDINADSQYNSVEDVQVVKTADGKSAYYDVNANGTRDNKEPLIINAVTYLDVNGDFRLNSPDPNDSLKDAAVNAYNAFNSIWNPQDSNTITPDVPDPIEPVVLQDGKGGQYLDLNFNQTRDLGEPFSIDGKAPMTIDPKYIVTYDIVRDANGKRYLDNNGSGTVNKDINPRIDDQALDVEISVSAIQKSTFAKLFNIGAKATSFTFLDVVGDRHLSVKDYSVLINAANGKRFLDIKRDSKFNTK